MKAVLYGLMLMSLSLQAPSKFSNSVALSRFVLQQVQRAGFSRYCTPSIFESKSFSLSGKNLTSIPVGILYARQPQFLDLSNNKITYIPHEFGKLKDLQVLDLSNNALTRLPADFDALSNLTFVDISGNNFDENLKNIVPICLIKSLKQLVVDPDLEAIIKEQYSGFCQRVDVVSKAEKENCFADEVTFLSGTIPDVPDKESPIKISDFSGSIFD